MESTSSLFDNAVEPTIVEDPPQLTAQDLGYVFERQSRVPGHDQNALQSARMLQVGVGGLGWWSALAMVRSGVGEMTLVEPDQIDLTNLNRTGYRIESVGSPKAETAVELLAADAVGGTRLRGIDASFEDVATDLEVPDIVKVDVDGNSTRLSVAAWARRNSVPCIITGIDADGGYLGYAFLQGPGATDACLNCAMPGLNPAGKVPCASVVISSCLQVASASTYLAFRALMGWHDDVPKYNLRVMDLAARHFERSVDVERSQDCRTPEMHASPTGSTLQLTG